MMMGKLQAYIKEELRESIQGKLREHIHEGYHTIRQGIGVLGVLFPVVLINIGGYFFYLDIQDSLSSYYTTPMRNVYIGLLCTIGICLLLYKGFSDLENWMLNAAGAFAFFTAIIPSSLPAVKGHPPYTWGLLHYTCAGLFFFLIGSVCFFLAATSLDYLDKLEGENKGGINTEKFRKRYKRFGLAMWGLPAALGLWSLIDKDFQYVVLLGEIAVVWTFSFYWLVKCDEMKTVDEKILNGAVKH